MFSIDKFNREYRTEHRDITIEGQRYTFLVPESIDRFIDPENPLEDFPLWAKIWQAGIVLAGFLSRMPVKRNRKLLEIGCGLGLAGIVAARNGHDVTLTDYNFHALEFAQANLFLNGCKNVHVERLDWKKPQLDGVFDIIFGSEIVYKNEDIDLLETMFETYLHSGGTIILVEEVRRTLTEFFQRLESHYLISVNRHILNAENEKTAVLMIRMSPRFDIIGNKQ